MGTFPVIPAQPALDLAPGFAQDVKQFGIQQFVPQGAIEALQVPVVIGLGLRHLRFFATARIRFPLLLEPREHRMKPWL
jgi:hypothetical protein